MIDIHCHILPNVDHGAANEEVTLNMLKTAEKQGTIGVVATPHYYDDLFIAYYNDVVNATYKLRELAKKNKLNIEIYHGQEVHFHKNMIESFEEGKVGTINSSRYMLLELPVGNIENEIFEEIYKLQMSGITPIIAHPERYIPFIEKPERINQLIEENYLFQLNSESITGAFSEEIKGTAEIFLKNGVYNFIGSDGHSDKKRNTGLEEALNVIKSIDNVGESIISIFENDGLKVINNEEVNFMGIKIK